MGLRISFWARELAHLLKVNIAPAENQGSIPTLTFCGSQLPAASAPGALPEFKVTYAHAHAHTHSQYIIKNNKINLLKSLILNQFSQFPDFQRILLFIYNL